MYGLCLDRLGRSDEAADYWGRALELDPSDAMAREMLSRHAGVDTDAIVP
jgi:Flp pilus assembly protein TadD